MFEVTRAVSSLDEALRLQFQTFPEPDRATRIEQLIESAENQVVSIDECLVCHHGDRIAGVLLLVSQTDGTIYVWPAETLSGLHPDDDATIRRNLYQEATHVVDSPEIWIGQSLLETDQEEQSRELSANGFPLLTDLIFMNHAVTSAQDEPLTDKQPDEIWASEPFDEAVNATEFARLVEQTYLNTCDVPELNGTRDGWESLASHRHSGVHCPTRWRLFRHEGRPAGLLLLTEHAPEPVWEVVYFGVAPELRGKGFGKRVLQAGIDLARKNDIEAIVLAVDVRNEPAMRLYEELDFLRFDRRIVHARLRKPRTSNTENDTSAEQPNP